MTTCLIRTYHGWSQFPDTRRSDVNTNAMTQITQSRNFVMSMGCVNVSACNGFLTVLRVTGNRPRDRDCVCTQFLHKDDIILNLWRRWDVRSRSSIHRWNLRWHLAQWRQTNNLILEYCKPYGTSTTKVSCWSITHIHICIYIYTKAPAIKCQ